MLIAPLLALLLAAFAIPGNVSSTTSVAVTPAVPDPQPSLAPAASVAASVPVEAQPVARAVLPQSVTSRHALPGIHLEDLIARVQKEAGLPESGTVPPVAAAPVNAVAAVPASIVPAPAAPVAAVEPVRQPASAVSPSEVMSDVGTGGLGDNSHGGPVLVAALSIAPRISVIRTELLAQPVKQVTEGGRNVRIQLALQSLLPAGYAVDVHPRLEGVVADWSAADTMEDALKSLRVDRSDVSIVMNTDLKVAQVMPGKEAAKLIVSPKPIQWELKMEDGRLDKALRRWAREAGYTFRWDADRYVLIAAPSVFSGSFENVVEQVLDTPGIKQSEYPLEACIYNNEPPLLRITRLGDQKEECK